MLPPSSNIAEVSFLDGPGAVEELRKRAQDLVKHDPHVIEVLLFGSLVKGNYAPGSDADLIIVLDKAEGRPLDRMIPYMRHFLKAPVPVDVFAYTRQELERMMANNNPLITRALREGLSLARKTTNPTAGGL